MMIAGLSAVSLAIGIALSLNVEACPRHRQTIEKVAGACLIAGYGLFGYLIESCLGVF
jgi:hypothetical protein